MEHVAQTKQQTYQASLAFTHKSGLLQRKCACGGSSGVDGMCEECRGQKLSLQRSTLNLTESSRLSPTGHNRLNSNQERVPVALLGSIQTKLSVSQPGDRYEQEADQIAEQVMRMPGSDALQNVGSADPPSPLLIQRLSLQSEKVHRQPEEEVFQAKEALDYTPTITPELQSHIHTLEGGGQPLPEAARGFMEPRFGFDFSRVRIHTGARAAESARAVGASAYTIGHNIVFGAGAYAPATVEGKRLLAHELTHTVQQMDGRRCTIQGKLNVGAGLTLDTQRVPSRKVGNVYTTPVITKMSIWNEIFTSLLFSPRVFEIDGTSNAQINANLNKHMTSRLGIIDFASNKQYKFGVGFGIGSTYTMNADYWEKHPIWGWRPKPGVDRLKAIEDLNVHYWRYAIACYDATKYTMEGGSKSWPMKKDDNVPNDDWIPGDWGWIQNTTFPPGGRAGLEGENIIYTGKDKFWGHIPGPGPTYKTLKEWFDIVKSWSPPGGARILGIRKRPKIGLK
jgi:hypothetical protein